MRKDFSTPQAPVEMEERKLDCEKSQSYKMLHTKGTHNYYVYVITNKAKTVLYIGFTTNLKERLYYHQNPEPHSKAFTAKYKCEYLVYWEHYTDVETAIDRETQMKKWNRAKNEVLISEFNPEWRFLNDQV